MTRRHFNIALAGETIACTLDEASGANGLLIVSGGREIRSGAFGGQAAIAAQIAAAGHPVMRFDRRGVGDSSGEDRGFRGSREDIIAAIAAFRDACPQVKRIVAFGNCDAASALMLMHGEGCDALVLANPWTFDDDSDSLPPPDAIRSRYLSRLRDPSEWMRLMRGKVNFTKLAKGLRAIFITTLQVNSLAAELSNFLDECNECWTILLAGNDRTAQAFAASVPCSKAKVRTCEGASHAFVEPHATEWLKAQLLEALQD